MTEDKAKKEYCNADDQRKVVEKMTECDRNSENSQEKSDCYAKVIKEGDGCMSS